MAKIFFLLSLSTCLISSEDISGDNLCSTNSSVYSPCNLIQPETSNCSFCHITVGDFQCDSVHSSQYSEWSQSRAPPENKWQGQTAIDITHIELKADEPDGSSQYHLVLKWSFVHPNFFNLTRGFLIHLTCKQRCVTNEDKCFLVDFHSYLDVGDEPSFTSPNMTVTVGLPYELTITSLPSNEQTTYDIIVPSTPPQAILELSSWIPVIAASTNPYNQDVNVIFQPAPASLNVTSYTLRLNDGQSTTRVNVSNKVDTIVKKFPGEQLKTYSVNLTVYGQGSDCHAGCTALPGPDTLQVFLPITPAPVPWEGATDTTEVPPKLTTPEYSNITDVVPTTSKPKDRTNIYIIIGVLLGVAVLIAIVIIIFILYRRRHRASENGMGMQILGRDFNADTDSKIPSVLVLYSYDCPAHEQVVIEFANFLKNEWQLEVYLDLWEHKDIMERGSTQWLNEKLIMSQFVIVISSTGARLKCARNRQLRMKYDRAVPDMFSSAVDLVLQRSHANRAETSLTRLNSQPNFTCLMVCFPYSCENDIPPKVDTWDRFNLMKDLYELYCKLSCAQQDQLPTKFNAISPTKYKSTRLGKQLSQVLQKAVDFFDNNRDWLAELLEPISPPLSVQGKQQQQHQQEHTLANQQRKDDLQPDPLARPLLKENNGSPNHGNLGSSGGSKPPPGSANHSRMSSTISVATEEDALLLEERRKKRQKEEELKMEKVPTSHAPLTEFHQGAENNTPPMNGVVHMNPAGDSPKEDTTKYPSINGGGGDLSNQVPPMLSKNGDTGSVHSRSNSDYSSLSRSQNKTQPDSALVNGFDELPPLLNGHLEDEELQRDIDSILCEPPARSLGDLDVGNAGFMSNLPPYLGDRAMNFNSNNTDLSFLNPVYYKMNEEGGKSGVYGVSDRNENFIIDLGNPQETLEFLTETKVQRHLSTDSERGTNL